MQGVRAGWLVRGLRTRWSRLDGWRAVSGAAMGRKGRQWRDARFGVGLGLLGAVGMGGGVITLCLERDDRERVSLTQVNGCLEELQALELGDRLATDEGSTEGHSMDYSFHPSAAPNAVIWPESAEEVSQILRICNKHKVWPAL